MAKCFTSGTQALSWLYVFSHLLCDVTKALFTHTTQSFVCFAKNLSTGCLSSLVQTSFLTYTKIFSSVTNSKDAVEKILEAYNFLLSDKNLTLELDSYLSSGHLIAQTWPIKVPIDVSGYTKNFACLGCEQSYKNEKLVITKFSFFFLQTWNSIFFFVVAREGRRQRSIIKCICWYVCFSISL